MALSERESERLVEQKWKRMAKGHPMRWRILRDAIAVLSLGWMTTSEFQKAMRRLWALKNKTSRDLLEELEEEGSLALEKDPQGQNRWGATREGVNYWIQNTTNIPARIVQVAQTSMSVSEYEEDRRVPGGPGTVS